MEISKFKSDAGQEVQLVPQEVKQYICPSATDNEIAMFIAHCQSHRLDPFVRDAYLVKYGNSPASIITSYQVFNRRARKCADYAGIESGVVTLTPKGTIQHKQGNAVYPKIDGTLVGGWAKVYVRGWEAPVYVEVSLSDYSTGRANWAKMPGVMIEKVAKSAAWRTAYPDEFSGMYTSEEMDQATKIEPERIETVEPDLLQPIRDRLRKFADKAECEDLKEATQLVCEFMGVENIHDLTEELVPEAVQHMDSIIEAEYAA